jgi:hypothetical protein
MSNGSRRSFEAWRKSTFSTQGECVEVRRSPDVVQVRNSRSPEGPILEFTTAEWRAFLKGIVAGDFSLPD